MSSGPSRAARIPPARLMNRQRAVPVSLGKPSLRLRLEAYYRIVAPDQIANESEWRVRYEQIWSKFGGSHQGEQKLAMKLAKKYGASNSVTLQLAEGACSPVETTNKRRRELPTSDSRQQQQQQQHTEDWYQLTELERNSGVVDFKSDRFDPVAALRMSSLIVERINPAAKQTPILDRVSLFQTFLPLSDPLYRPPSINRRTCHQTAAAPSSNSNDNKPKTKLPFCFASMAHLHEKGPLSVLYKAFVGRKRIRVLIRYVNGIRGTLTGYLVAFDKHMNMILRDADEVYSPRHVTRSVSSDSDDNRNSPNVDVELRRRQRAFQQQHELFDEASLWTLRQRHMKTILVRGDNVVLVYFAEDEMSAWPINAKSPPNGTLYRRNSVKRNLPAEERIGSPGSLIYAASVQMAKQQKGRNNKRDYSSSKR